MKVGVPTNSSKVGVDVGVGGRVPVGEMVGVKVGVHSIKPTSLI